MLLLATGEGIAGLGVAVGFGSIPAGVTVYIPFIFGSVNAASIEREKTPASKPPRIQAPSTVKTIQRVFICQPLLRVYLMQVNWGLVLFREVNYRLHIVSLRVWPGLAWNRESS